MLQQKSICYKTERDTEDASEQRENDEYFFVCNPQTALHCVLKFADRQVRSSAKSRRSRTQS
jgi:hypothetical protein